MYRIKLASGQETVYQSIDELTNAVTSGEVTGDASIYHQRADRWLSISNHPHYQIAISRAQAQKTGADDASKRQVITAVRPAKPEASVPPTMPRVQLMDVVAELDKGTDNKPKRVSIPSIRKPEEKPSIPAYENMIEGVQVPKPPVVPPANGNGHPPIQARTNGVARSQTTVMPIRTHAAPPPAAKPALPDLGDGFDLTEDAPDPMPKQEPVVESSTPQVDKLLSLLDPSELVTKERPVVFSPAVEPVKPKSTELELIEFPVALDAGETKAKPVHHEHAEPVHHIQPHIARKTSNRKPLLIAIAAVIVLGAGLLLWHPWGAATAATPTQTLAAAPVPRTDAFGGTSSIDTAANSAATQPVKDSAKTPARDSAPAIVRVAAPRISMKAPLPTELSMDAPGQIQIPAATLIQHYTAAYADARGEMELRMLQSGFTQIFRENRLSSTSGLQDTRRLVASASAALRQYRSEEQRSERAYQDTVGTNGHNVGWTPRDLGTWNIRPTSRENQETARLTNLMLSQMDNVFSLLQDQDGKYQISGESIVFESADAARQYGTLRAWINQQADNYSGSGDAALPATLRQIVKGIGSTRLPQERSR
jgi:hypothetical protein